MAGSFMMFVMAFALGELVNGYIKMLGVIANWMRNRNTIEYRGLWETLYNPNFNPLEFEGVRKQAGLNAFTLSPTR